MTGIEPAYSAWEAVRGSARPDDPGEISWFLLALSEVAVEGGAAYPEGLADRGGSLPVGLQPPGKGGLIGIELGGPTKTCGQTCRRVSA